MSQASTVESVIGSGLLFPHVEMKVSKRLQRETAWKSVPLWKLTVPILKGRVPEGFKTFSGIKVDSNSHI